MGFRYIDYTSIDFTNTEQLYVIGTDLGTRFRGEEIEFLPTQDCYVRFNASDAVQVLFTRDDFKKVPKKTHTIWVQRVNTNGTLEVWSFGNIENPL